MTIQDFRASTAAPAPPADLDVTLQALWWDARGDWKRAHECVDSLSTPEAMAVHAYLHRKEGDAGNAGYWYARAGARFRRDSLDEEWTALAEALLSQNAFSAS